MKKVDVKVELHGSNSEYYCIFYRPKRKINLFNFWIRLEETLDDYRIQISTITRFGANRNQPVLFENFDLAVERAKELKANPELIDEHNRKEEEKFILATEERNEHRRKKNRSYLDTT